MPWHNWVTLPQQQLVANMCCSSETSGFYYISSYKSYFSVLCFWCLIKLFFCECLIPLDIHFHFRQKQNPGSPLLNDGPWNKSSCLWSFFIFSLRKRFFEHRYHDLTLFFFLVQPLSDMLSFICVTPLFSSQALSPVTLWQLSGWTDSSILSFSWHFVFSACVTKAHRSDSSLP